MAPARATFSLLQMFYAEYSAAQESVKRVASLLRGAKHMVSCGVVKPTLKSAALYLRCAFFINGQDEVVSPRELFQFLATSSAHKVAAEVNLNNYAVRCVHRAGF